MRSGETSVGLYVEYDDQHPQKHPCNINSVELLFITLLDTDNCFMLKSQGIKTFSLSQYRQA